MPANHKNIFKQLARIFHEFEAFICKASGCSRSRLLQALDNAAKDEDAAGPRHQDHSCSYLPQDLDNAGNVALSAFLKGKQHSKKSNFIGLHQRFDLMKVA